MSPDPDHSRQPPTSDYERWEREILTPFLAAHPERRTFETPSGVPLRVVYPHHGDGPWPGEYPFTRGIYPSMYRGRLWTQRQYAGYSSPRETNERFHYLLSQGQTGLSVAFDLPTQIGYDADDPEARGEVGRVGVSISTVDDLDELFSGIPLERVSVSMTINATASILLALYCCLARRRGIPWTELRGTIQNDILKEYVARGTQRFPVAPSLRLAIDIIEFAAQNMPRFHPVSVSGYHIREAGATAVEELGFTLANAITYLDNCRERGLDLERIGRRLSFFFNAHNHLFEEVAKFRAARRMWSTICRDRFHLSPEASMLRFHAQTGGSTLTAQEPENNAVRVTIQALAAILGGSQSLHTNGADEALSLPTEKAAKLALRTQQILARESGVGDVVDPLGGCPLIEELTNQLEALAGKLMAEIDKRGGMVASIENGFVRRTIEASAYRAQQLIDKGDRPVGVDPGGIIPDAPFQVDEGVEQARRDRIAAARRARDADAVAKSRARLADAARAETNTIPLMIEALDSGMTLGEIVRTLSTVFGECRDV